MRAVAESRAARLRRTSFVTPLHRGDVQLTLEPILAGKPALPVRFDQVIKVYAVGLAAHIALGVYAIEHIHQLRARVHLVLVRRRLLLRARQVLRDARGVAVGVGAPVVPRRKNKILSQCPLTRSVYSGLQDEHF